MKIYPRPEQTVFAEAAHEGELQPFPDIARGWGKSLDLTGGIPPMEWFNALGKRSDEAIRYLSQRGISEWSADELYPQGAVSYFNEQLWFALKNNHNQQPQQGIIWQRISFTEQQIKQLIPVNKVNGKTGDVQLTATDVGALSETLADNRYAFKADIPAVPVQSVNGKTGSVTLTATDVGALTQKSGDGRYALKGQIPAVPVQSVNDKTGAVKLNAADVGALTQAEADGRYAQKAQIPAVPVQSVNDKTGAVKLNAADVGALTQGEADGRYALKTDIPPGIPQPWPLTTPPTGWLKCDGSSFDKNRYPLLANAYPSGVLPDLRGEFIRGWDDSRGIDNNRYILSSQSHAIEEHQHQSLLWRQAGASINGLGLGEKKRSGLHVNVDSGSVGQINMTSSVGGIETRPRNIAFLYIVRAA